MHFEGWGHRIASKSQELINRVALDAGKSIKKLSDFYELNAEVFDDETCTPESASIKGANPKLLL